MTGYSVACLSGDGIGPEVMAQASRAVSQAARLHGFSVEEAYPPFGADAWMRVGHPFPASSRAAVLEADAVLTATLERGLQATLEGELDLRARILRVRLRGASLTLVAPLDPDDWPWALEQALAFRPREPWQARARHRRVELDGGGRGGRRRRRARVRAPLSP